MPAEGASPVAGSQYPIWKHMMLGTGYFADAKFRHDSRVVRSKAALAISADKVGVRPAAALFRVVEHDVGGGLAGRPSGKRMRRGIRASAANCR